MLLLRVFVVGVISIIVSYVHGNLNAPPHWLWVGMIPTFFSIFALLTPFGTGWWWKQRMGGRNPSQREQLAYHDAIDLLQNHSQTRLPLPASWFVLDTHLPDAAVNGNTLMLSRGLLESDHLPAVLAHELGHLASPDGRLTAALNRLVILKAARVDVKRIERYLKDYEQRKQSRPYVYGDEVHDALSILAAGTLKVTMFARGGFGLWLTQLIWGHYWRKREYKADKYAAQLGQAEELADFLEAHALIHDHPVPYIWLTEHTHPPSELRIDKLRDAAEDQEVHVRPGPAPTGTDPLIA